MERRMDYLKEQETLILEFHGRLEHLFEAHGIHVSKDPHTASQLAGRSENVTIRIFRTMHDMFPSHENTGIENAKIPTFIIKFETQKEEAIPGLVVQNNETLFLDENMPLPSNDDIAFFANTINSATFHTRN